MDSDFTRWRSTIRSWLMRLDYVLEIEEIISSIERQMIRWKFDLASMEAELLRNGKMNRHQKRASWDALRFVLYLDLSDLRREPGRKIITLNFDPAAAEIDADLALQQNQEALEEHLSAAMKELPKRLRVLVVKRVCKGATFRELADESGMSLGHTYAQFNMAIAMLGRAIDEARRKKSRV